MKNLILATTILLAPVSVDGKQPVSQGANNSTRAEKEKELHVTVDFNDDYRKAGGPVAKENIGEQMARFAELGIDRVYWIHHAEDLFLPRPLIESGVDLLEIAVDAAHRHGMEFYALFKPFETGRAGAAFPHNIGIPDLDRSFESIGGHNPIVAPFVLKHPEYRLKRREFEPVKDRTIGQIKLVKADDKPTRLKKRHLRLFTSRINGDFRAYEGEFGFGEAIETRNGRRVRVLTLAGLEIPPAARFVLIQSALADDQGDFRNIEGRMIELYDSNGRQLPATVDEGSISREQLAALLKSYYLLRHGKSTIPDGVIPANYGNSPAQTGFHFDAGNTSHVRVLDGVSGRNGVIAAAKGKNHYTVGALNPVYTEVRQYWRREILSRCVDARVDGITIRIANHSSWSSEGSAFGFNPPVIEAYRQRYGEIPTDEEDANWRQLQGEFFTQFLRELKKDLTGRDVRLQLSVNYLMLKAVPGWRKNNVPENFIFEWRKWITEDIADSIELKYFPWPFGAHRGSGAELIEPIVRLAHEHGKPVFTNVRFDTGIPWREVMAEGSPEISPQDPRLAGLRGNIRAAWDNPSLDGVILYEGASFTKMFPKSGKTAMAPFVKALIHGVCGRSMN